jgi:hypothetical protein
MTSNFTATTQRALLQPLFSVLYILDITSIWAMTRDM